MSTQQETIQAELDYINRRAKRDRKIIRALLPCFTYSNYSSGYATIEGFCGNFEEYLEESAKLPTNNEMYSYDLYWDKYKDDCLVIRHKVPIDKKGELSIVYQFKVREMERTLEKLTEGKCKVIEKVEIPQEHKYTALSCNF